VQRYRGLVYVVNRRTVVDQTTNEVERLRANLPKLKLPGLDTLAISTLRGQFADNREWSADPSRPAVIVGTVDMIGSRLLFSGYGVGFKAKPLHAGFLGQNALIVHDEAHLEPAFQKLLESIVEEQTRCKDFAKFRVMKLTATTRSANGAAPFELTPEEKNPPEVIPESTETEPSIHTVWRRLKARKKLVLTPAEDQKAVPGVIARIAEAYKDQQAAVLVFVRSLEAVSAVQKELGKTKRPVVLLTGTIRGRERDELVDKGEFKRFLKGAGPGETVYLVCTSAGEVGIDISAHHMVCDLSTFDSMAQRFGRVNRYGLRTDTRPPCPAPQGISAIN
jgi:CRISPR-associated endonuclease/helicase Cas3